MKKIIFELVLLASMSSFASSFATTTNILDVDSNKLAITILKNIQFRINEDDLWIQDGNIYDSADRIDPTRSWCELDTSNEGENNGRLIPSTTKYLVSGTGLYDSNEPDFFIGVKDSYLNEIECEVRNSQGYLSLDDVNNIGQGVFRTTLID